MAVKFGDRRLQKGTTSYFLTIPPACIDSIGLAKGAKLAIEMLEDHSLKITPN